MWNRERSNQDEADATFRFSLGPLSLSAPNTLGLGLVKVGLLLAPLVFFIPALKINAQVRAALIALVVIASFWLAGLQASPTLGELSNAATVALYLTLFLTVKGN